MLEQRYARRFGTFIGSYQQASLHKGVELGWGR
jgi:hypothetical protein